MEKTIVELAKAFVGQYSKDPDAFLITVGKFASVWGGLVLLYCELVKDGHCQMIEDLPSADKQRLWKEAKLIAIRDDRFYLTELCKALHGFETFRSMAR